MKIESLKAEYYNFFQRNCKIASVRLSNTIAMPGAAAEKE